MLSRLYVDNFLCFSNFELSLQPVTLLLGKNGSGKTSIIELIDAVRRFVVNGVSIDDFAPSNSLTRWDTRDEQRVVLAAKVSGEHFEYSLVIRHTDDRLKRRVIGEELSSDGDVLFRYDDHATAHLYNDSGVEKAKIEQLDWSRSALGWIREGPENKRLTKFRSWLERIQLASPDPRRMQARSEQSKVSIESDLSDFAAWLRGHFEAGPQGPATLDRELQQVLDGFETLRNENLGGNLRRLQARFRAVSPGGPGPMDFAFDELSDGQRALVALYALLMLEVGPGRTLMIDEPDNFLALGEIQPWLNRLQDLRDEKGGQVILVSHHPEVLNQAAVDDGVWLWRDKGGPVRSRRFQEIADRFKEALTSSEIIARGWTDSGGTQG